MTAPTPHNEARPGEIADAVLLPGDPKRAAAISEKFLDGAQCYNQVRNMLGFTGTYRGRRVSVQGTGMGMPSIAIYATELFRCYGVTTAIRVGSCGALQDEVSLRDLVIATAAHTDSAMVARRFKGITYAPAADFGLAVGAWRLAQQRGTPAHVGTILSSDTFYDSDPEVTAALIDHGVLAVEMEAAALYTIAAAHRARALCISAVSDHIGRGEKTTSAERETGFLAMAELALDVVVETMPA
ncbi:MAG: purine-nucleoside phosphorylase [Acidimicrobiales bacterium]